MPIFKTIYGFIAAALIVWLANGSAGAQSLPFLTGGTGNVSGTFYSYAPARDRDTTVLPGLRLKRLERSKDPYYQGLKAYLANDFKRARKLWKKSAAKGHLFAQWRLANLYRFGKGTKVNHRKAFKYYRQVARQHINDGGNLNRLQVTVDSIVKLGHYYRKGIQKTKIKADPKRAFALYQLAATHYGHSGAQLALGQMYINAKSVKRQTARGIRWINLAARKNNAQAQAALGNIYWSGKYVRKNQRRALTWYILASQSANKDEFVAINEQMIVFAGQLSEKTREKARRVALAWRKKRPLRNHRQKLGQVATITPNANVPPVKKNPPVVRKSGQALKIKPEALK
jgi:exopolysaccharide production negative regulator